MKKLLLLILTITSLNLFGQSLIVTPYGLRDSLDIQKKYVVINMDGKSAKELFDNSLKYINKNYKNPDAVIKAKTENEYLKFITYRPNFLIVKNSGAKIIIDAKYTIELSFKDNKFKFEIVEIDMYAQRGGYKVLFMGGLFEGYPIYDKNEILKRPETKKDIETSINAQLNDIFNTLSGKNDDENW